MSKKNVKRLESKKKKAAAFIELIRSDENYQQSKEATGMQDNITSSSETQGSSNDSTSTSSGKEKSIADEMFAEYKKMMREKQKAAMLKPKVFLTLDELTRDDPLQTEPGEVKVPPPLFMADVQHLLLYGLQGNDASMKPRWCRLLRVGKVSKVVAVVLDSLSSEEFKKFPDSLPTLAQAFDLHVEMISPLHYGSSVREDIMNVPMSISQLKKKGIIAKESQNKKGNSQQTVIKRKGSSLNRKLWSTVHAVKSLVENPLEPVSSDIHGQKRQRDDADDADGARNKRLKADKDDYLDDDVISTYEMDKFDRRWLMLNTAQMICERIPTPINNENDNRYKDFVFSKRKYKAVTSKSPLYAVDCEMIQTKASSMDLARVSFVDENLQVVYDSYVKPWAQVRDYVTRFSGITKEILDPVTTRIQDVQRVIQNYLPSDAILVGHSICSDLSSMKVFHPYIIDTSVIYNIAGNRRIKAGLKRLSAMFLGLNIQMGNEGHSSVEDAKATMELVLLKLRNNMEFGDILMSEPDFPISANSNINSTSSTTNDNVDEKTEGNDLVTDDLTETTDKGHVNEEPPSDSSVEDANKKSAKEINNESEKETKSKSGKETDTKSRKETKNKTGKECDNKSGSEPDDIEATKSVKKEKDLVDIPVEPVNCECSSLTKTLISDGQNDSDIQRRRLFFQNEGNKFIENFLQRIKQQRRQGALIDEPDSVSFYPGTIPVITCNKDKDREKQTLDKIQEVGFCFTHLYGYRNHLKGKEKKETDNEEEDMKKCLWKLDRRFWKIMMGLPSNSLFVVILPGREENGHIYPAMTFAKIT